MNSEKGIQACLDYVAKKENMNLYEFIFKEGSSQGDGYLGDTVRLELYGKTDVDEEKVLHLFIKSSSADVDYRKNTPLVELFEREIFVYNRLFEAYADLQDRHHIKEKFSNIPRFYGYVIEQGREHIILEDIFESGYRLHDRKQTMNLEHAKLIFKTYGRLHALSFSLKDQEPDLFRELSENYSDLSGKLLSETNVLPAFENWFIKEKQFLENTGYSDLLQKLDNYEKRIPYILTMLASEEKHDFVFLHGDSWNNNFMFKYEDGNYDKPVDVCILDWQLSRLGSPVIDLSHYMYSCLSKSELDNTDDLFRIYYDALTEFLSELDSDPTKLFPRNRLLKHLKKYGKFGIFLMFISLHLSLLEEDEFPDVFQAVKTKDFSKMFCSDLKSQGVFHTRATNAIVHAVEGDLL